MKMTANEKKLCESRKFLLVGVLGVALVLCMCALCACSSGGQDDAQLQKNFQGTWKLSGMSESGQEYGEDDIALIQALGGDCVLTLNEDKSMNFEYFGENETGTWEVKDASTANLKSGLDTVECKLKDAKLTIEVDGASLTFAKKN